MGRAADLSWQRTLADSLNGLAGIQEAALRLWVALAAGQGLIVGAS